MHPEEQIFEAAAALPEAERPAYLDKACAGEPELRARIEALLRADEATGFMEPRGGGFQPPNSLAEQPGDRIGRYKLMEKIGEGGFGVVWVAEQQEPVRRRVALKIIKPGMDSREVIARFEQERQALAMMDHPNIAKVFDAGATDKGRPFFVMELVRGVRITDYCDQASLPTAERLNLFISVCQAVQHAHQKGIIHRDLKPSNILVTPGDDGQPVPKVIDFGVAKAIQQQPLTDGTVYTQFEQMIGTPAYMSPEQAGLGPMDIDTRSDVYSLGVLLYELLTGRPPFDPKELLRAGLDEMRRVIREVEPPRPSTRRTQLVTASTAEHHSAKSKILILKSKISADLDWIVMKALEKDRARRYESATGLVADLRRHLENQPVLARPPGRAYLLSRFIRRHKFGFAAGLAISLSVLGGIAGTLRALIGEKAAKEVAETQKDRAESESKRARAQVREASRSDLATAQQHLAEGRWQEAVAYLGRAVRYDPESQSAQNALWLALRYGNRDSGQMPVHFFQHEGDVVSAVFSPDGKRIVTASRDGTARVWDTVTGQPVGAPLKHEDSVGSASFSPDGSRIVTVSKKTAQIWDASTGSPVGAPLKHDNTITSASFNPDSTRVVTASWDKAARVWDATTGSPVGEPLKHEGFVANATFSPDGTRIATASMDKTARLWDANTGQLMGAPLKHEDHVNSANFSPDGRRVVTASLDKTARVWDANTGQSVGIPLQSEASVKHGYFSPDSTRIITVSEERTAQLWDANTGQPIGIPMKHESSIRHAKFSPDGRRVVTSSEDRTARVCDAATGQPLVRLDHEHTVNRADFSSDGSRIVTACADGTAQLWDASTGQARGFPLKAQAIAPATLGRPKRTGAQVFLTVADKSGHRGNFSPDGRRVVTNSEERTAQLWDAISGQQIGGVLEHQGFVVSARFSPDSSRVFTASRDSTARIWDANTGRAIGPPLQHNDYVYNARSSPDGSRVLTASKDHTARLWDASTGEPIGSPLTHQDIVNTANFSPEGSRVVTASKDGTARLWDASTGKAIGTPMKHDGSVAQAYFSPDGRLIVTASDDGTARVWEANTGQPIGSPLIHGGKVVVVSFSLDGRRVVTASNDGTVRVWDANTCQPICPPMKHEGVVKSASFSPKGVGAHILAMEMSSARLWDADSGKQIGAPLRHKSLLNSAAFSPDGRQVVTASVDLTAQLWDADTSQPVGPSLKHESGVNNASFSLDSCRIIATTNDKSACIWDATTRERLSTAITEILVSFTAGARLDAALGSLQPVSPKERLALWQKLEPMLEALPDWHFAASQSLPRNPQTDLISPRMTATVRQTATSLIGTMNSANIREAAGIDPAHPLLPFAVAKIEAEKTAGSPANSVRAAWLIDYGMKRLPADTRATDLRLAARLVANVLKRLPEHKAATLTLLDRAAKLEPEEEETKAFRESLQ